MSLGPLQPLATYAQFLIVLRDGKLPLNVNTKFQHDAKDPAIWMTYEAASAWVQQHGPETFGVGYYISSNTGFFCLDIDGALEQDGSWSGLSQEMVALLPGCVTEVSQSGRGLHIWGWRERMPLHRSKNTDLHVELYSDERYILLGHNRVGQMTGDCLAIDNVVSVVFPPRETGGLEHGEGPCPGWRGPTDDDDLLRRALQSRSARSAFGRGASFQALWDADAAVLAQAYPTTGEGPYDASSADAALAQHLAFWTGKDTERIGRLMRLSKLARGKWEREDYFNGTIFNACSMQIEVLSDPLPEPSPLDVVAQTAEGAFTIAKAVEVNGSTFLSAADQVELFKGCVYVIGRNEVLVPGGDFLAPNTFRSTFGGRTFCMDTKNERTTRNAFEAFTESQAVAHPKVNGTCFRPKLPFGAVLNEGGVSRVNTFWPIDIESNDADVTPFTTHVHKLLPNGRDAEILISFMAFCVQHKGHKATWAILLQGVEGNGKSFISRVLTRCLGKRYVHPPKASELGSKFNSWLVNKLLICVEDIHKLKNAEEVMETLKPMIAGLDELAIEGKGVDQVSADICANFLLNTNHRDGLKKSRNDRRICWLACAQQEGSDLARDGLTGQYMVALHNWARDGGYAAIHGYLKRYEIAPDLDPSKEAVVAPPTTTSEQAVDDNLEPAEAEILEAIAEGDLGFKKGWVSTHAITKRLSGRGLLGTYPKHRWRGFLQSRGYRMHPKLKNGQTDNPVLPDAGRPVLYLLSDHPALALERGADVARAYAAAQM